MTRLSRFRRYFSQKHDMMFPDFSEYIAEAFTSARRYAQRHGRFIDGATTAEWPVSFSDISGHFSI